MKIIKYLGWEKCDYSDYKKASYLYGYNNETSPHYIDFAIKNGAKLDFYALTRKGEIVGSCCVDNGWLCNDTKNAKVRLRIYLCLKTQYCFPSKRD